VAVQPNGDIVVADSFGLARYLPDGKLDTSFGAGGLAGAGFAASALAIQPNGGYVVAGLEQTGPELRQDDFTVARLTTSGRLDTSPCEMSKTPPRMLTRGPRFATIAPAAASTGTPPMSLPPTSSARPGKNRLPSCGLRLAGPHRLSGGPYGREQQALTRHAGEQGTDLGNLLTRCT
jgi:hypothetical protein